MEQEKLAIEAVSDEQLGQLEIPRRDESDEEVENGRKLPLAAAGDDITARMLWQSRQIAEDVSKSEVMLLILQNINIQVSNVKQCNHEIKADYETLLELELKPQICQEHLQRSQLENQIKNTESVLNKLKVVMQNVVRRHGKLQEQKCKVQYKLDALKALLKTFMDKIKTLLPELDKRVNQLKDKEFEREKRHLENVMSFENNVALSIKEKTEKEDCNSVRKYESGRLEECINLQTREQNEVNVTRQKVLSDLSELNSVKSDGQNLIEKIKLREAALTKANYKLRLETLQNKISDLNEANSKTQNSATELSVLEENISELESQRDALLTLNTTMEEKTKNAEEELCLLQKIKLEIHSSTNELLQLEKTFCAETKDLMRIENNYDTIRKLEAEEESAVESFVEKIADYTAKLAQQKQQYEDEVAKLTNCSSEMDVKYEKDFEHKEMIAKKQESHRMEQEQMLTLKLEELERDKAKNEEMKESLRKSEVEVERKIRLKKKLEKEKASLQGDYQAKYLSTFQARKSWSENVKGILKPPSNPNTPKRVTFQGVSSSSQLSSSNTLSQTSVASAAHKGENNLFDILQVLPSNLIENKKRKSRLDSP